MASGSVCKCQQATLKCQSQQIIIKHLQRKVEVLEEQNHQLCFRVECLEHQIHSLNQQKQQLSRQLQNSITPQKLKISKPSLNKNQHHTNERGRHPRSESKRTSHQNLPFPYIPMKVVQKMRATTPCKRSTVDSLSKVVKELERELRKSSKKDYTKKKNEDLSTSKKKQQKNTLSTKKTSQTSPGGLRLESIYNKKRSDRKRQYVFQELYFK